MANGSTDINAVSTTSYQIPEYLDFDTIRSDSIAYLGELTGAIWTDYNEHDPGITMLEMLCYAMLDLNYRSQFPVADILSRTPGDTSPDNNFFTAAKILGCNPLTITDYRKLLIDLDGVKNAWLEIDKSNNPRDICKVNKEPITSACGDGTIEFINGLYHVCIELDDGYDAKEKEVVECVKKALSCYRNLCEDFIDIFVLCKFDIGVCTEIEIELNADPEEVYESIILALQNFFSPAPKFYKLQDLLAKPKCKHIEDIFSGRPYNTGQSHGFVDIDEFEQIKLKKEIHLSDVYNVIKVDGVKTVRQLTLQKCENGKVIPMPGWRVKLPENYIPVFSTSCSGFKFTQNKKTLQVDFQKFEQAFKLNFAASTKVLYPKGSPYLDAAIPNGIYRKDLGDYFSIQNEFPRVYGIAEGGIMANATKLRQAQALQLKGYLLFFDQMLADYLVQLNNIRELFSFSSDGNTNQSHTYFLSQLGSVPDLNKLLRFSVDDSGQTIFGPGGSVLGIPVIPTKPKEFPGLPSTDPSIIVDPSRQLQDYFVSSPAERDIAIQQLLNDISNGNYQTAIFSTPDGCYFIYLACTDFAIRSKTFFQNISDANQALSNIQYLASFKENYRSFVNSESNFSFDIEFNAAGYINYLQLILENKSTYRNRREAFLNHLLSRFAEKFTDYALLSYGFLTGNKLTDAEIKNKEKFLSNYPELSSNRGKAYDYQVNGWDSDNISGFEKRFEALTGIENWKRHSLCNFEVIQSDRHYTIRMKFAGFNLFSGDYIYDEKEDASKAALSLFKSASDFNLYDVVPIPHEDNYHIKIQYGNNRYANYTRPIHKDSTAREISKNIYRHFSGRPLDEDIIVSKIIFKQKLVDHTGKIIRLSKDFFETESDAFKSFRKSVKTINEGAKWEIPSGLENHVLRLHIGINEDTFIDLNAFKIDPNNDILGKPLAFTYSVLDFDNNFKFLSVKEFNSESAARADSYQLITLMSDIRNYNIVLDTRTNMWKIYIHQNESTQAECVSSFNTEMGAINFSEEIFRIARKHIYTLVTPEFPYRWKFHFLMGFEINDLLWFQSADDYDSWEKAFEKANAFSEAITEVRVTESGGKLLLEPEKNKQIPILEMITKTGGQHEKETQVKSANSFLELRKVIARQSKDPQPKDFNDCIAIDEANKEGEYIYRLVDKDNLIAKSDSTASTEQEAKALKNTLFGYAEKGYEFLEICLGGDIVVQRVDKNGVWYHYVIKCRIKILNLPGDSILFESYTGYSSEQDAEDAFNQNYLLILSKALDKANYGAGKFISIEETFSEQHNTCIKSDITVVIPKKTYQHLGTYDDEVVREMVKLAGSYPVRMIVQIQPVPVTATQPKTTCPKTIETIAYSFSIFNLNENKLDWISTHNYDSADKARQNFYFFLLLLNYKGNYYVDYDHLQCKWVVYIREVLAESNRRFKNEKDAWGKEGVEKLICVAQTDKAFHHYFNRQICCDSFYIACGNGAVIHPCSYESAEKRNQVLESLYTRGREFIQKNPPDLFFPHDSNIIRDLEGKELAEFLKQDTGTNFTNYCNRLIDLIDCILDDSKYREDQDGIYLANKSPHDKEPIARPIDKNISLKEWKERLIQLAYYFPVIKNTDANGKETFCVEIKFPCFNSPCSDLANDEPCGCGDKPAKTNDSCYVAWKSTCCFDSCRDAFEFYYKILPVLINHQNYRPVYDCNCGPYRIELFTDNDIIAFNPQCYNTPAMNCDAVDRANKLVNAEGLHIVEHILLRPHCKEDCSCSFYTKNCDSKTNCHFTWEIPGVQDPCNEQENICFVPGEDPYSFIATVALPAWPARFRKKENRQLLEDILQREAPAHVLLRILWLAPHDFCCFEAHFKKWNQWLAQKNICNDSNPSCEFLNFLFERNFECLKDCTECAPCKADVPTASPCFSQTDITVKTTDPYQLLNQTNELFCWKMVDCGSYKYIECDELIPGKDSVQTESPGLKKKKTKPETAPEVPKPKESETAQEQLKTKSQFINSRSSVYKNNIAKIIADTNENEAAIKASSFLSVQYPTAARYKEQIELVLVNKTDKANNIKGLSAQHKKELINNLTRHFLDKQVFVEKDNKQLSGLKEFFELLRSKKVDTNAIYNDWQAETVKKYEQTVDIEMIESLLAIL